MGEAILICQKGGMFLLLQDALSMQEKLVTYRRSLHTFAETGFDLPATLSFVRAALQELGCSPKPVGKAGLTALIGTGSPCVLLRADMDALPVREESGLAFASRNGNAHVCGHDIHTAMLLGAAALLKKREADLCGSVLLVFQPAEELLAGAADMLGAGLLEDSQPQAALMLHVMNAPELPPGTVVIPPKGVSAPAADFFEIEIRGRGTHGGMPHCGVDPINAGAHVVTALQAISTREMAPGEAHALTISAFQAGEAANVMPDAAYLRGSVRSYAAENQLYLKERISTVASMTAQSFRTVAQVHWHSGCPTLVNHEGLVKTAEMLLPSVVGSNRVLSAAQLQGSAARSVGSEDFSYISHALPSLMLAVAAGGISEHPLHHPAVVFNEDALPYGAAVYAGFAIGMLHQNLSS